MVHILGHLAERSLLLHKCQACLCNLQLHQAYKAPLDEIVNPCKWLIFIEIPLPRACRKTTLSVTETSRPSFFLSAGAVCSILPASIPFLLTCRPVPGPASACSDCRRGETEDLPSPASARDVPWAC